MKVKKKVKKKRKAMCYVEELKKWVTLDMAVARLHKEPEEKPTEWEAFINDDYEPPKEVKFTKAQKAICKFIMDEDKRRGVRRIAGPVDRFALRFYLEDTGFPKTAARLKKKDPSINEDIYMAWVRYRKVKPFNFAAVEAAEQKKEEPKFKKGEILGINVSALLRFLGKEGFEFDDAKKILDHFGHTVKDSTIRGQLWCGTQRGKYGEIPKPLPWQIAKIMEPIN